MPCEWPQTSALCFCLIVEIWFAAAALVCSKHLNWLARQQVSPFIAWSSGLWAWFGLFMLLGFGLGKSSGLAFESWGHATQSAWSNDAHWPSSSSSASRGTIASNSLNRWRDTAACWETLPYDSDFASWYGASELESDLPLAGKLIAICTSGKLPYAASTNSIGQVICWTNVTLCDSKSSLSRNHQSAFVNQLQIWGVNSFELS